MPLLNPTMETDTPANEEQPHWEQASDARTPILTILGILTLIGAGFCLLSAIGMLIVQFLGKQHMVASSASAPTPPQPNYIALCLSYMLFCAVATVLGIGTLKAKRWARALGITLNASWAAIGAISALYYLVAVPYALSTNDIDFSDRTTAVQSLGMLIGAVFGSIIGIVIPGVFAWLYARPRVREVCELRNPAPSWTDACPLPVLAAAISLAIMSISFVFANTTNMALVPFFGSCLSGMTALIATLAASTVILPVAWGLYKGSKVAWGAMIAILFIWLASNLMTSTDTYLAAVSELGVLTEDSPAMMSTMLSLAYRLNVAFALAAIAYVVWIVRYFRARAA